MAISIRSLQLTDYRYRVYDVNFFNDTVNTLVTATAYVVHNWISDVERLHQHRLHNLIVGLDVEWRPNTYPGAAPNRVATLQLCVDRDCLIFQLNRADGIPQSLMNFLTDQNCTFVGVGIGGDAEKLHGDYGLQVLNTVDLRDLAVSRYRDGSYRSVGLKKLASDVIGKDFEKPRRITMSDWDVDSLSLDQIQYACVDAFASSEIGKALRATG